MPRHSDPNLVWEARLGDALDTLLSAGATMVRNV
jgi:hypothetical protein